MQILLTGATGFLGSHLLEALIREGYKVVILKRSTSDVWRIAHLLDQITSLDVDKEPIETAFYRDRVDTVIHTACHYGRNSDSSCSVLDTNLMFGLKQSLGMQRPTDKPVVQQPRAEKTAPCEPQHIGSPHADNGGNERWHPDFTPQHLLTDQNPRRNNDDVFTYGDTHATCEQQAQHNPWKVVGVLGDEFGHAWALVRSNGGLQASRSQRI